MGSDYPYLVFMRIAKQCRERLAADTLESASADLYDALYSDSQKQLYKLKMELYETEWLEMHWDKINESVERAEVALREKKSMVEIFARQYNGYISQWDYTELDGIAFEERMNILKSMISVGSKWEQDMKRMKVSFDRSKKLLNERINNYRGEED